MQATERALRACARRPATGSAGRSSRRARGVAPAGLAGVAVLVAALLVSAPASGQELWTVLPPAPRGVDPVAAETFRDLLQHELAAALPRATFVGGVISPCSDATCAVAAGRAVGADVAVFGSLSALGEEIVVTATAVDVRDGSTRSTQRLTVTRVEELDTAAERVARAMARGITVEETAQLGSITMQEAEAPLRREGDNGFGVRLAGVFPLAETYGGTTAGIAIDLSFWYEALRFAIEPRVGLRFATDRTEHHFLEVPIEIGGYYILGLGDAAPFFGGGTGVRWVMDERPVVFRTGTVLRTEQAKVLSDDGWGFSVFGRAGVLFLRTYTTRLAFSVDYNAVFLDLNEVGPMQSFTVGVSVIF
jgi:hypothetical protein